MFILKRYYDHRMKAAGRTYRELQRVEAELERVKHERDLARAMAEGYKAMSSKMEKDIEYYKNMYERERRKNAEWGCAAGGRVSEPGRTADTQRVRAALCSEAEVAGGNEIDSEFRVVNN